MQHKINKFSVKIDLKNSQPHIFHFKLLISKAIPQENCIFFVGTILIS